MRNESDREMRDLEAIAGGLELLPLVKPLWEGLREHHSRISSDFSDSIRNRSFEERAADFMGKSGDHIYKVELVKGVGSANYAGYCISSISSSLVGEVDSLYVDEAYRGLHIGDMLMKSSMQWMDEHSVKIRRISVMAGNDVLGFYDRYGFKVRSQTLEQVVQKSGLPKMEKARTEDAEALRQIQHEAFLPDLITYGGDDCPANESIEGIISKIGLYDYYKITLDDKIVGGVVVSCFGKGAYRLKRIFIDPSMQNKGIGAYVMKALDDMYPDAEIWTLDTPNKNFRNHHFYEKYGYVKIGEKKISDKLVLYEYERRRHS